MTSIALITTTINVPHVLRTYREYGPDVQIIVAGDVTTDPGCPELCDEIGARYIGPLEQEKLYPALSGHIGWRSIQRRNIALLEAIRSGADIVVTVDDDNEPKNRIYFRDIASALTPRDVRLEYICGPWFNPGMLGVPQYRYRGLPVSVREFSVEREISNWGARIGVVNGLVLGDPDINATERIERAPVIEDYYDRGPLCINPKRTWAPINSQNTAYVRELAPLAAVIPGIGRYDDIWGSYVAQAVMRCTDYHVAYGPPYVRQERNPHNLIADLKAELYGMEHTEAFTVFLRETEPLNDNSVFNCLNEYTLYMQEDPRWERIGDFYALWLSAVSEVL